MADLGAASPEAREQLGLDPECGADFNDCPGAVPTTRARPVIATLSRSRRRAPHFANHARISLFPLDTAH
jgi:hypothetical protein